MTQQTDIFDKELIAEIFSEELARPNEELVEEVIKPLIYKLVEMVDKESLKEGETFELRAHLYKVGALAENSIFRKIEEYENSKKALEHVEEEIIDVEDEGETA